MAITFLVLLYCILIIFYVYNLDLEASKSQPYTIHGDHTAFTPSWCNPNLLIQQLLTIRFASGSKPGVAAEC